MRHGVGWGWRQAAGGAVAVTGMVVCAGVAAAASLGATSRPGLDAHRTGSGAYAYPAKAAPGTQERPPVSELLRAVEGTPPVACELALRTLGNRWGSSSVRPRVHVPLGVGALEQALAESAWTGRPGEDGVPDLMRGLASPDPCARRLAAALFDGAPRAASAELVALADRADGPTRQAALAALGYLGGPDASAALRRWLPSEDPASRSAAAWALGSMEDRDAAAALVGSLRDLEPAVRENAAWALGRIEGRDAVAALTRALADREVGVRVNAAWALGQIEDPAAIPALSATLGADADAEVRRAAAWALGRIEE